MESGSALVNVSSLQRLYVTNGSFNTGTPGINVDPNGNVTHHPLGWDAYSHTGAGGMDTQLAGYDSSGTGSFRLRIKVFLWLAVFTGITRGPISLGFSV